ncbi:MAG: C-terminal binding protein [Verrucomicrobiota bacterium]|nr:C-terminal binding protein [Verrucomicrobiota bacterium]
MSTPKPRVVVTDYAFSDLSIEQRLLSDGGCELIARQCMSEPDLIELCKDADAVITQFARVNARVINAMSRARGIVRYGIGVDNVDLDAARARGIPVCNIPGYCIEEVADHTLAFMLGLTRQVVTHTIHLRAGKWGLAVPMEKMKALRDLTVGVVGFGRIGREVVKRLMPFKCFILVSDPAVSPLEIAKRGGRGVPLDDLLRKSDLITLHCPSTPETRQLINRRSLASLKPGAILINVGRGDLVDLAALTAALESGQVGAAALDVFDPEPIPPDHPILKMSNLIVAPHIASASPTAVRKLRETAAQLALKAVRGEPLPTVVNGVQRRMTQVPIPKN